MAYFDFLYTADILQDIREEFVGYRSLIQLHLRQKC